MKKKQQITVARRTILYSCVIIIHGVLTGTFYFIAKKLHILPHHYSVPAILTFLLLWLLLPAIVAVIAFYKKYDEKIVDYWQRKKERKYTQLREDIATSKKEIKNAYSIKAATPADKLFVFRLEFDQQLYPDVLPSVLLNFEMPTSIWYRTRNIATIYIGKAVMGHQEKLAFTIGANTLMVPNPYFLAVKQDVLPAWQCKGNIADRKIIIPKQYFPEADSRVIYPFGLYVDGKHITDLYGTYMPDQEAVVVLIGRAIHSSDCLGKNTTLRVRYGRGNIIPLAQPTILPAAVPAV